MPMTPPKTGLADKITKKANCTTHPTHEEAKIPSEVHPWNPSISREETSRMRLGEGQSVCRLACNAWILHYIGAK